MIVPWFTLAVLAAVAAVLLAARLLGARRRRRLAVERAELVGRIARSLERELFPRWSEQPADVQSLPHLALERPACRHEQWVEITSPGQTHRRFICADCGATRAVVTVEPIVGGTALA